VRFPRFSGEFSWGTAGMSFGDRRGDVRPDVDDYRVITTRGEIRRGAAHGCQARMGNPGFMRMGRATPLQSPNLSTAEKLYVAGEAGAGTDGCARLTGTPCEDAESCSTIWVGRTSGGTSNASLTLT
jgi:hypothetical protein